MTAMLSSDVAIMQHLTALDAISICDVWMCNLSIFEGQACPIQAKRDVSILRNGFRADKDTFFKFGVATKVTLAYTDSIKQLVDSELKCGIPG